MPQQQIIWTALPNGRSGEGAAEKLMLSVVVSPRLRMDDGGTGALQSFPDLLDWPAHAKRNLAAFDIVVDDNESSPIAATIVATQLFDSALWQALFPPATLVRSQKFEGFQQPIATYPISTVAGQLKDGYGKLGMDAPFRPSDKAAFKRSFANLAQAMSPAEAAGAGPLRERVTEAHTLGTAAPDRMHRELAASLLRSDPSFTFDDKLAETTRLAGALARSAPPEQSVPLVPATAGPAAGFTQFAAFHRRAVTGAAPAGGADNVIEQPSEDFDFHRMLTALGDYPWLMRRLGLVIDIEVVASLVPKSSAGALRQLRAQPRFSAPVDGATTYTPVTKYILDDTISNNPLPFPAFLAAPRAAEPQSVLPKLEIVGGLLNLRLPRPTSPDDLQFDIINVDVDGAAKKVVNAMGTITHEEQQAAPIGTSAEMAAPTIQSSGLTLARTGQADLLMADVAAARVHEDARLAGRRAVLFAEDLVRGYRIDIRRFPPGHRHGVDHDPAWLSLHSRVGTFRFKRDGQSDITLTNVADEGFVQPAMMQERKANPQDPNQTNPIFIHESYAHWQGWSLSAPFPAEPLDLTPKHPDASAPVVPPGLLRVEVTMEAAPGTLPRLRFGHSYQMCVRTVDLAGNGLTLEGARQVLEHLAVNARPEPFLPLRHVDVPDGGSDPVVAQLMDDDLLFRRFDPIASPVLVLREELMEGEAVDVMVIRSNGPTTTTASYAADLHDARYKGFNERHIVPPKSSQRMVERHGRLDGAFGLAGEPQTAFAICRRGVGTLNDPFVTNLRTGEAEPLPDVIRTDPATGTQTTIQHGIRLVAANQARPQSNNDYPIHYEEQLRLPYLPDPMAQGAALFHLPGVNNESLVLVEGSGPGAVGRLESKRNDDQLLPQRAIDELGLITKIGFPPAGEWPELRTFRLRLDGLDPASTSRTPTWSEANGARILTVRLAPAEVKTIWISTYPNKEDVPLFGLHFWWARLGAPQGVREFMNMAQHGALAMLTPAHKIVLVHAVQQPLIEPRVDGAPLAAQRFSGDTVAYIAGRFKIHGRSTEKIDLLASWREPLQDAEDTRLLETHVLEVPIHLDVDPADTQGNPVPIATYTQGTDRFEFQAPGNAADAHSRSFLARHEFGDTRHRRVTYQLVATTRFKDYFPESITQHTEKLIRTTTFENVIVRNSVRPPALEISSIVPAFRHDRNFDLTSGARSGGRLRVYLGPTWFATGEGEAVGVVGEVVAGADPLHAAAAGGPSTIKPIGSQPVPVAGQPGLNVFPFPVHRDRELGLWYTDLAFDVAGLYFPFIRLRLARFQEHSLDGFQLSPVVEAGFHQLLPDRAFALAIFDVVDGEPGKRKIEITVSGARATAAGLSSGDHLTYKTEVEIQERALGSPDDKRDANLGWKRSATIVPFVADPSASPAPSLLWKGHVLVPVFSDMERRIVIREFELFPPNNPPPGQAWLDEPTGGPSRRLVYAEVIPVR